MKQKKFVILIFILISASTSLLGQCPEREVIWKRLIFLRDSAKISPDDQLKELTEDQVLFEKCSFTKDSTYAFLLQKIAAAHAKKGDYFDAIRLILKAIKLIKDNPNIASIDQKHVTRYYYYLSTLYDSLGEISEKIKAFDSCIYIAIRLKSIDAFSLFSLLKKLEYWKDIGDYTQCMNDAILGEELTIQNVHGRDSVHYIYNFLEWKATALLLLKNFDAVERLYLDKISELIRIKADEYLPTLYEHLAEVYTTKRNYKKAAYYFARSLAYDEKAQRFLQCAITSYSEGYDLYFLQLHDNKTAMRCIYKALQYIKAAKNSNSSDSINIEFEALNIMDNIAEIFVQQEHFDTAAVFFQKAFDQLKVGMNETDLLDQVNKEFLLKKSINYLVNVIIDKADLFLLWGKRSGDLKKVNYAINIYKIADKMMAKVKTEQGDQRSKLFWRNEIQKLYEHGIEATDLTGDFESQFYFFEKSKAVLLNDQLSQLNKISNDDILQQAQINKKILQLEKNISTTDASAKNYAEMQTGLFSAKQESDRIEQSIKTHNPLYYQSFLDTTFITLKDVQTKLLKEHQALIELFNGDSAVYSLIITPQKTYLNKIDKVDYYSTANLYITFISNEALLNSHYVEFNKIAHHLYQLIFGNNIIPNGRIIISPDGEYFPFESLVTNSNFQFPVYFLNDHAVSYTYSARFLLNDFSSSNSSSKNNFLGVAPVRYALSLSLPALNGSDKSLNEIENYFSGTDNYVSDKATKTNFTDQFSKYKVIQLYTHSSDTSSHNEPVIFFQDSALYLSELIPENKPSTQLIVLSACETANGQLYRGEGVFSFNRGFAALGIPSSITNLWSVDDRSTYKLTELFYKYLAKGLPLDVALQNAKKEFIQTGTKESSLPYYWAAPVLVGKTDAIELNNNLSRKNFFFAAVVCLLLFFAVKYFVRKSQ